MKVAICKKCGKEMEHNQGSSATWLECSCGETCRYAEANFVDKKMIYLLAYKLSSGKQALAVSNENTFVGTENLEDAKTLIPNWNGYHKGGLTWSTSATLYWMSFHPHIVAFNTMEEVSAVLCEDESQITTERNIWGAARYTIIKDDAKLNVVFDPKLIDEGIETAKPFWEK